jgi:hypothetical protein
MNKEVTLAEAIEANDRAYANWQYNRDNKRNTKREKLEREGYHVQARMLPLMVERTEAEKRAWMTKHPIPEIPYHLDSWTDAQKKEEVARLRAQALHFTSMANRIAAGI